MFHNSTLSDTANLSTPRPRQGIPHGNGTGQKAHTGTQAWIAMRNRRRVNECSFGKPHSLYLDVSLPLVVRPAVFYNARCQGLYLHSFQENGEGCGPLVLGLHLGPS